MKDARKVPIRPYKRMTIAGREVKVAEPQAVKASSAKLRDQYSRALENLKNR